MAPKRNPLKLNKLQLRTLALAQVLADDPDFSRRDEATGAVTLTRLPEPHGDHVHIGEITVSMRAVAGLSNQAVWVALARKGLAGDAAGAITLTAEGIDYDTGLADQLRAPPE